MKRKSIDNNPKAALFLDRDGTIIKDKGYLTQIEEIEYFPDTFLSLKKLQDTFKLFIITNQSGVSKGFQTENQVKTINNEILKKLKSEGINIEKIYTCPHTHEDNCLCRKPLSTFPLQAAIDYNISLEHSFSLGDHLHDVELGLNFGGRGLYILTGHGERHKDQLSEGIPVVADLTEATKWLLKEIKSIPDSFVSIETAADYLKKGEVVGIPTETVYGLAGNGLNEKAVLKIFEAKKRPHFDPLILHITSLDQLDKLVKEIPEKARLLAEHFWPGPLTMVLPRTSIVPDMVTSGLETVAIRMPSHPVAREIIEKAGCPLAAPSANLFGQISPSRASHVDAQLGGIISGIVDGGACSVGIESTIIGFWGNQLRLLRPGGIPVEEIEGVVGTVLPFNPLNDKDIPAPGTMKRHYSPKTSMILVEKDQLVFLKGKTGYLVFGPTKREKNKTIINLSSKADLKEAALNLYHSLRILDKMNLDFIVAEKLPQRGLGRGINDRLERAASK